MRIPILYQDADLVVVDKPGGLPTHAAGPRRPVSRRRGPHRPGAAGIVLPGYAPAARCRYVRGAALCRAARGQPGPGQGLRRADRAQGVRGPGPRRARAEGGPDRRTDRPPAWGPLRGGVAGKPAGTAGAHPLSPARRGGRPALQPGGSRPGDRPQPPDPRPPGVSRHTGRRRPLVRPPRPAGAAACFSTPTVSPCRTRRPGSRSPLRRPCRPYSSAFRPPCPPSTWPLPARTRAGRAPPRCARGTAAPGRSPQGAAGRRSRHRYLPPGRRCGRWPAGAGSRSLR